MPIWRTLPLLGMLVLAAPLFVPDSGQCGDDRDQPLPADRLEFSGQPHVITSLAQLAPLLEQAAPRAQDREPLRAALEKPKGSGLNVYPRVAPAVVVVLTQQVHGTGFLIHKDGWVVTNNHVIFSGNPDPQTGALVVTVHLGKLVDNQMRVVEEGVPALLYKSDPVLDLALLKLTRKPAGMEEFPVVRLAGKSPIKPGLDCFAVGHPAAGLLWTLRSGEVSGVGDWPRDMSDLAVDLLALGKGNLRDEVGAHLAHLPQRKVILSSCGLNPGDSGGPLVNDEGELLGVSFAIPGTKDGVSLAKFSYHVHLDPVKKFLADREQLPASAPVYVPDLEPPAAVFSQLDLDHDGKPEALFYGRPDRDDKVKATGLRVDLAGVNAPLSSEELTEEARRQWQGQFAIHWEPYPRTFYDTDGDGHIDLILQDSDGDGKADVALRLREGKWVAEKGGQSLIDPALFTDKKLQERFTRYAKLLKRMAPAKP